MDKTASQINHEERYLRNASVNRSQMILRESGNRLTFDDLLAEIYYQAIKDTQGDNCGL